MFRSQLFHGLKAVAFTVNALTRDPIRDGPRTIRLGTLEVSDEAVSDDAVGDEAVCDEAVGGDAVSVRPSAVGVQAGAGAP
jgi:hypothetical protein